MFVASGVATFRSQRTHASCCNQSYLEHQFTLILSTRNIKHGIKILRRSPQIGKISKNLSKKNMLLMNPLRGTNKNCIIVTGENKQEKPGKFKSFIANQGPHDRTSQ